MLKRIIAKTIGYAIKDYVNNSKVLKKKKFLMKSQFWSREKLMEYQFEKLKKLITHAYHNVPYYREVFDSVKITPENFNSFDDYKKIPILTKDVARLDNDRLFSKVLRKDDVIRKTGGTTGPPLKTCLSTNSQSYSWAAYYRFYNWMGINMGDNVVTFWGAAPKAGETAKGKNRRKMIDFLTNDLTFNTFNANKDTYPDIVKKLKKHKPKLIRGYLSAILDFAYYVRDNDIKGINPKAILTTTETLLPLFREVIESAFNCKVYNQYGAGECNSVAFECSAHIGMHVDMEHALIEVLNDEGEECKPDEVGRLIVTDLDNHSMPIIRYEIGDLTSYCKQECTCGVTSPLLNTIEGRMMDPIVLGNGSKAHPVFFTHVLFELKSEETNNMRRFQVYQEKEGEIEFRIEEYENVSKDLLDELKKVLLNHFSEVKVKVMKELEYDKSGKFRYAINKIPKSKLV